LQNIDPIWFLQPLSFTGLGFGLVIFWYFKRRFSRGALLYSLIAYGGAIAVKEALQLATYRQFYSTYGHNSDVALGLYFGLQTVFFEVGGAYIVARFALSRNKMNVDDAEGYGLGLGFWENGVLLGVLALFNIVADYAILSMGTSSHVANLVYNALNASSPSYFSPPATVLPMIGYSFMERVTSVLFHLSWGYLCLFSVYFHKRKYFLIALPMGLLDFIVPFEQRLSLPAFEVLVLVLGICAITLTWFVTRKQRREILLVQQNKNEEKQKTQGRNSD
jgi:hypothetical protein